MRFNLLHKINRQLRHRGWNPTTIVGAHGGTFRGDTGPTRLDGMTADAVPNLSPNSVEAQPVVPPLDDQYQEWLRFNALSAERLLALRGAAGRLRYRPVFSILMTVYNEPSNNVRHALEAMRRQVYPDWEMCIVHDESADAVVRTTLEEYARLDSRIKLLSSPAYRGAANASNAALSLARGEFVGVMDPGDELWPNALYECAKALNADSAIDFIYSDEDRVTLDGKHRAPLFKPDWSPELLLSTMYTGDFAVYRRCLVEAIGGFLEAYEACHKYDLVLRISEKTERIHHIPTILYSRLSNQSSISGAIDGESDPSADLAARAALNDAVARRGNDATVEPGLRLGTWRVHYHLRDNPEVTIVVPTGGNLQCLAAAIESFMHGTTYQNFEMVIVDNSEGEAVRTLLQDRNGDEPHLKYLEFRHRPFNYSKIVNHAIRQSTAPYIVLLNDDVTLLQPDWIQALLEHAQRPEIGVVGTKLLFPDGTIQHAGIALGIFQNCGHVYKGHSPGSSDPLALIDTVRNVSAVTFALTMFRRAVFDELGGLDEENLAVVFNDVDFCLRARERGYRVVYTPYAAAYHHESATRGTHPSVDPVEVEFMREIWREALRKDPYYNPNFTRQREDGSLNVVDR